MLEQLILKEQNAKGKDLVTLTKTIYKLSKGKIKEELTELQMCRTSLFYFPVHRLQGKKKREEKKKPRTPNHSQSSLPLGNTFIFLIFFFPPDVRQGNDIC